MLVLAEGTTLWEKGEKVGLLNLQEGERSDRFVIVERSAGPLRESKLTEAEEKVVNTICEATGGKKKPILVLEGVFQRADTPNANNRIYPDSIWKKVLESGSKWLKSIQDGDMMGEVDHPKDGDTQLKRVACLVTDIRRCNEDTKTIRGRVVVFDTRAGRDLKAIHEGGGRLGVSSRGQGTVVRTDGKDVVQEDFDLQTWDIVYNPSTPGAYPNEVTGDNQNRLSPEKQPKSVVSEGSNQNRLLSEKKPESATSRPTEWNAIVRSMAETPITEDGSQGTTPGRLRAVRESYRRRHGVKGPLTEQERSALAFYVEAGTTGNATEGVGNYSATITFGGGLTEALGSLTMRAQSEEALRDLVAMRLGDVPNFVTVEYNRDEAIYEECAARFNSILEEQVSRAREEAGGAAVSDVSTRLDAAKEIAEMALVRAKEAEDNLTEVKSDVQAAEAIIEGLAREIFAESLKAAVAAIAATNPKLEGLPIALSRVDSISEAIQVTKEMRESNAVFLEREPLGIRNARVEEALKASKSAEKRYLEEWKKKESVVEKRESPALETTKSVVGTLQERGIGK